MTESQTTADIATARYKLHRPGEAVPEGYELCGDPNWVVSIRGRLIMRPEDDYSRDYLYRPSDTDDWP